MEPYEDPSWWYRVKFSVRERLRSGILRLRSGWLQILQTGVAACVAWFLAVLLLGLDEPTFAPIAAVISLGLAMLLNRRRGTSQTQQLGFVIRYHQRRNEQAVRSHKKRRHRCII